MHLNMIKQMERYARHNTDVISLGQGIPSGQADMHIRNTVISAIQTAPDIDMYSDPLGILPLRQAIAAQLRKANMSYASDEIIITSGAIEAINATLLTLVTSKKSEVIIPTPTYSAYQRAVAVAKGTVIEVGLDESHNWQLSLDDIQSAISPNTAALLLCNPNNPTGSIYDQATLLTLCKLAEQHDFTLIVDEVYGNMLFDTEELFSPAMEPEYREHVVRVVSFSKDFNLTGWRIGFMHASRSLIDRILPVHDTLVNCAALPSQYAALAALEIANSTIAQNRHMYQKRRRIMQRRLDDMSEWFSYTLPQGGYFFFPKLRVNLSAQELSHELALRAQVVTIPGDDFGNGGQGHLRLCFGRSEADIHIGMQRLQDYLQKHAPRTSKTRYAKEQYANTIS